MQSLQLEPIEVKQHEKQGREPLLERWPTKKLLDANLEALQQRDASLADAVRQINVPDAVEEAIAQDGSVTYRFRHADGRRPWFGGSSVPLITAQANIERTEIGAGNMAMNTFGHGADAQAILQKMAPYQALVVTEPDILHVRLAFGLRDFSGPLRTGRLVILVGDDPVETLERFFGDNPGYNIINTATSCAWLSDQQNQLYAQQVALAMERAGSRVLKKLSTKLDEQANTESQESVSDLPCLLAESRITSLRVANCSNALTPTNMYTSRDALAGLAQLGAQTDWQVLDQPNNVSHYAQMERLQRLRPHVVVLVDMLRGDMPKFLSANAVCVTLIREAPAELVSADSKPAHRMGPQDLVFPASHSQLRQLQKAGLAERQLVYLPLATNTELFKPIELSDTERHAYGCDVAIVGDRPSSDPETYGIKLPTHQLLWQQVIDEIKRSPERYHASAAGQFLRRAQQCGIELQEDDVRRYFTDLISNLLGPAVLWDIHCDTLQRAQVGLRIWSAAGARAASQNKLNFWTESPVAEAFAGSIVNGPDLNKLYNSAKIHIHLCGDGKIDRHLLDGIAAGAFFLVRTHPDNRRADGVGRVFELGKELIIFDSPRDLRAKVGHYLTHEDQRKKIAEAAHKKILTSHSYAQRMQQMLETIHNRLKA